MREVLVSLLLLVPLAARSDVEAPFKTVRFINFGGSSYFHAHEVTLAEASKGLFKTENAASALRFGDCENHLELFQKIPLKRMRENGYINEAQFNFLSNDLQKRTSPRQYNMVEVSYLVSQEWLSLHRNEIKDDRITGTTKFRDKDYYRISASTLWAVRGQVLDVHASDAKNLTQKNIPWEFNSPLPSNLPRLFDREKIKSMLEFGRLYSETGPLKGDIKTEFQILVSALEYEYNALGIPLDEIVTTAETKSEDMMHHLAKVTPLRPLDPTLQKMLEDHMPEVFKYYLSQRWPPPGVDWSQYKNTVLFGRFSDMVERARGNDASYVVGEIKERTQGRLSGARAKAFFIDYRQLPRKTFDFHYNGDRSPYPISLMDFMSPIFYNEMALLLRAYDVPGTPLENMPLMNFLGDQKNNNYPDLAGEDWAEDGIFLPWNGDIKTFYQGFEIRNLDPITLEKVGEPYLASVILSIHKYLVEQFAKVDLRTRYEYLITLNQIRAQINLPPLHNLDQEQLFDALPIFFPVRKESPTVKYLRELNGIEGHSRLYNVKRIKEFPYLELEHNIPAYSFLFKSAQIKALQAKYPNLLKLKFVKLDGASHSLGFKILNSGLN